MNFIYIRSRVQFSFIFIETPKKNLRQVLKFRTRKFAAAAPEKSPFFPVDGGRHRFPGLHFCRSRTGIGTKIKMIFHNESLFHFRSIVLRDKRSRFSIKNLGEFYKEQKFPKKPLRVKNLPWKRQKTPLGYSIKKLKENWPEFPKVNHEKP